jgi:hypothetical protein
VLRAGASLLVRTAVAARAELELRAPGERRGQRSATCAPPRIAISRAQSSRRAQTARELRDPRRAGRDGSLFALVFLFVPSINTSYWMLSALTTQILVLMYILVFAAALRSLVIAVSSS